MEYMAVATLWRKRLAYHRWLEKVRTAQRRKLFDAFTECRKGEGSVLNLCIAPTGLVSKPDYLIAWSKPQERACITSWQINMPLPSLRGEQPAPAIQLPFADQEFDWVFCNEVLEHAGASARQLSLVHESYRVARKGIFITTGNRRHPIEFNTGFPFLHHFSPAWRRRVLGWVGKEKWASDEVFNPVDAPILYRFASLLPGAPVHDVGHKRVLGYKAHFFLMVHRPASETSLADTGEQTLSAQPPK